MDELAWYLEQLDTLIQASQDYRQKALLEGTKKLLEEQEERLSQMAGQLDGSLWSPQEWRG